MVLVDAEGRVHVSVRDLPVPTIMIGELGSGLDPGPCAVIIGRTGVYGGPRESAGCKQDDHELLWRHTTATASGVRVEDHSLKQRLECHPIVREPTPSRWPSRYPAR